MSDSDKYIITAQYVNEDDNDTLYWNSQQIAVTYNGWTKKLSEVESYVEEEKANEVLEKLNGHLQKAIEDGHEKRINVKDFKVVAISRKELLIARMKGV